MEHEDQQMFSEKLLHKITQEATAVKQLMFH